LDLPGAIWRTPAEDFLAGTLSEAVARLEEAMIRKALREAAGNRAAAARQLGIHRQLLYSKIKQYGIDDRHLCASGMSAEQTVPVCTSSIPCPRLSRTFQKIRELHLACRLLCNKVSPMDDIR